MLPTQNKNGKILYPSSNFLYRRKLENVEKSFECHEQIEENLSYRIVKTFHSTTKIEVFRKRKIAQKIVLNGKISLHSIYYCNN